MIKKIIHLGDIHIRKSPTRHGEYRCVFKNLYKSLKKQQPDRIVIVGDLFHDYIDLQGEAVILASEFLNNLSEIAPIRITRGNHDYQKRNKKRTDSIEALINVIDNPNIIYYNTTGFFHDENITWAVWHHGDDKSPWKMRTKPLIKGNKIINLFHDPIKGSRTATGFELNKNTYHKIKDFNNELILAGDIHKMQYFYR